MKDSEQMELNGLTLSVEASPARTLAPQEKAQESRANAPAYGQKSPDLLANYDPNTSSWRTSQRCLVEGWTLFSETWPRSGTMQNGIAYRRVPLVRLTAGIESGSWPTPSANEDAAGTPKGKMQKMLGNDPRLRGETPEDWAKGTLSPIWVCWLMGFPLDWLDLDGYQSPELDGLPPEYLTAPTS